MLVLRVAMLTTILALVAPSVALAAPGDLVSTFGDQGVAFVPGPPSAYAPQGWGYSSDDLLLDSQGRLIVVGQSDDRPVVSRLTLSGSPHGAFGKAGYTKHFEEAMWVGENNVAIQDDDEIVVSGTSAGIFRFTRLGQPDSAFGDSGWGQLPYGAAFPVVPVAGGGIVTAVIPGGSRSHALKLTADGAYDPRYQRDPFASESSPHQGAFTSRDGLPLPDGGITWGGISLTSPSWTGQIWRTDAHGELVPEFGDQGVTALPELREVSQVVSVADGYAVIGPRSAEPGSVGVVRVNADGTVDRRFGVNGVATLPWGRQLAAQPDRKLVVVGSGGVARLTARGKLDTRFGIDGVKPAPEPFFGNPAIQISQNDAFVSYSTSATGIYVMRVELGYVG